MTASIIQQLPEHVINRIAAGEVVERPASVAKELIENALDAEATQISVRVEQGGIKHLSVLDNGRGLSRADTELAVARHATSKLHDLDDLESLHSFGFRGEALASIAAVSRFELLTSHDKEEGGTRLVVEGGKRLSLESASFGQGTRVTVADLFFNVPARQKFLRGPNTEFQRVQEQLIVLSMTHPRVQFRLRHRGREVLHLPPATGLSERIGRLFPRLSAEQMESVAIALPQMKGRGLISRPAHTQGTTRWQYLFVNGRQVRSPSVRQAIYKAYDTLLMKGQHPAYVLFLDLPRGEVDINVHPAKSEVRLRNPQLLFSILSQHLHGVLLQEGRRRAFGREGTPNAGYGAPASRRSRADAPASAAPRRSSYHGDRHFPSQRARWPADANPFAGLPQVAPPQVPLPQTDAAHEAPAANLPGEGLSRDGLSGDNPLQALACFRNTYIIAQREDNCLLLIDQHAAHERILFEVYRQQLHSGTLVSQRVLVPQSMRLGPQNALLLEHTLPHWKKMGFELEPVGHEMFIVRALPALLAERQVDIETLVIDTLGELSLFGKSGNLENAFHEILERVACHAAIRAGDSLGLKEAQGLLDQLATMDIHLYCPHGRPVWIEISKAELEQRFKRVV